MIIGLLGSASAVSLTATALRSLGESVVSRGDDFELVDLGTEFRSLHDIDAYNDPPDESQMAQIRARMIAADGVVLATPVYHGSFSGLLKNALDHLTGDAFERRPVGTIAAGGGVRSANVACDHLRTVIRAMGGWSTPTHVGLSRADIENEKPTAELEGRIAEMVDELLAFRLSPCLQVGLRDGEQR